MQRHSDRGVLRWLQQSASLELPLTLLRRARAELSRIFARIIQARRESKATEEDILQCFIDSRYEKVGPHILIPMGPGYPAPPSHPSYRLNLTALLLSQIPDTKLA